MSLIGQIDVLINNAGLELMTPITDSSDEIEAAFRRIVEINVIGTALVTRAGPAAHAGGGIDHQYRVDLGPVAEPQFGAYVASKHAIIGLTKTWAKELGPRANPRQCGLPRLGQDRCLDALARPHGGAGGGRRSTQLSGYDLGAQALPGLMEPADVADTYLFLASDLAANITGQSLGVDRGEVPMVRPLLGKRALVTGAASGIGRATARPWLTRGPWSSGLIASRFR